MKYKFNGKKINKYINSLDNYINNNINEKIVVMDTLAKKAIWTGPARNRFVQKYDDVMFEIKKLPEFLSLYTDFLNCAINNYGNMYDEFQKKFAILEEKLERSKVNKNDR